MSPPASVSVHVPGNPIFEVFLDAPEVSIGRGDQCSIGLRDMNVSRLHCAIERRELGYVVRDKNSSNGTRVNGVSVMDKLLDDGDRIQLGGSVLMFRRSPTPQATPLSQAPRVASMVPVPVARTAPQPIRPQPQQTSAALQTPTFGGSPRPAPRPAPAPPPPPKPRPQQPQPDHPEGGKTFALKPGQTPDAVVKAGASADPPGRSGTGRIEQHRWHKLAEVACAINLEHDSDRLLEQIVDAVLELVPSLAAFLVLCEGDDLTKKVARNADTLGNPQDRLSRQICREAIEKRHPILTQDAEGDEQLGQFLSVANMRLKSILCVPFASQDEVLGVVYLDEPQVDLFRDDGELVELVGAFGDMAGIALANARLLQEIAAQERLAEEVRIASRIQANLLPKQAPPIQGLEVAAQTIPARGVGGDVYDMFRREAPHDDVIIAIGDVSGKGVGAGLIMTTVRSLVRVYAESEPTTDRILAKVNHALARDLEPGQFVSYLLIRYDEATGRLHYTGAGHEHLVLKRNDQVESHLAGGVVLGITAHLGDKLQERTLDLAPGDAVCLYTDGATEAPNPQGDEYGLERVEDALRQPHPDPQHLVDHLIRDVLDFAAGAEQHDDLTVLALFKR